MESIIIGSSVLTKVILSIWLTRAIKGLPKERLRIKLYLTFGWIPIVMFPWIKICLMSQITAIKLATIRRINKKKIKTINLDPETFQNWFKHKSIPFKKTSIKLKQINHGTLLNDIFFVISLLLFLKSNI